MDFLELAKNRQSDRGYLEKPIKREKINYCIQSAQFAPSACNSQPWRFVVIDNPELIKIIGQTAFKTIMPINHWAYSAPVIILQLSTKQNLKTRIGSWIKRHDFRSIDSGIAVSHLTLAAESQGIASCIIGWFNEKPLKSILKIPRNLRIEMIITMGYAKNSKKRPKKRLLLEQICSFNEFCK